MAESYPKPESECRMVRSIIRRVNPDILALQEIGDEVYLNDLWRDLNQSDIGNYTDSFLVRGIDGEERHLTCA